ncbi:DUF971 domain-containing protein [Botrimarina sp.]|uniref:DUF971 domain-containing protein n=1 Tax=Botrimarina sp. TaxID=2795802 RepID=UPI0032EB6A52
MPEEPLPTAIERDGESRVLIEWSDGARRVYTAAGLRAECPCATCRERRSAPPPPPTQLTVLSTAEAQPLTIRAMRPVGSYAYQIVFSDGHDSGLFRLEWLRELGAPAE